MRVASALLSRSHAVSCTSALLYVRNQARCLSDSPRAFNASLLPKAKSFRSIKQEVSERLESLRAGENAAGYRALLRDCKRSLRRCAI